MTSPPLKTNAVTPLWTPRSLRALFVQLNSFHETVAAIMHAIVKNGVTKPTKPETREILLPNPLSQ
jgi:hypothetical protein